MQAHFAGVLALPATVNPKVALIGLEEDTI